MNTKSLLLTIATLPVLAGTAFSTTLPITHSPQTLSQALDKFDKSKVQCYCVCEFDGRSQLAAGVHMAKMFEGEFGENDGKPSTALADLFQGFIGISSGALLAVPLALGQNASDVEVVNAELTSKLITPKGVSNCLSCMGTSAQIASYFVNDGPEFNDESEPAKLVNNYDAIVLDNKAISKISDMAAGEDADLKAPLTILSTSTSANFAEQTLAAIKETDAAAVKNATKLAFDTLLKTAQTVTSVVVNVAGKTDVKIDKTAAEKALDIMTKVDTYTGRLNTVLDNTVFKKNLVQNLGSPTAEKPVLVINLKAKTGSGNAIKTSLTQETANNFIKLTYTTELPLGMYPSKKLTFNEMKLMIESSVVKCMESNKLDSAESTDIVSDFLTAAKLAKVPAIK